NGFNTLWPEISALCREFDVEIFGNQIAWWTSDLSIHVLAFQFANLPLELTFVCQPAVVSGFRPFKQRLRSEWVLTVHRKKEDPTTFKRILPSRRDVIMWIMKAWKNLGGLKGGFAGLFTCSSEEPTSVEPVNGLVEELENLIAVSDSDERFESYSGDDV
ncbi:hypothetical protein GN958_ATG06150, partial [Phytophthora infestans]